MRSWWPQLHYLEPGPISFKGYAQMCWESLHQLLSMRHLADPICCHPLYQTLQGKLYQEVSTRYIYECTMYLCACVRYKDWKALFFHFGQNKEWLPPLISQLFHINHFEQGHTFFILELFLSIYHFFFNWIVYLMWWYRLMAKNFKTIVQVNCIASSWLHK